MHIECRSAQTPVKSDAFHDCHNDLRVMVNAVLLFQESQIRRLFQAAVRIAPDVGRLALVPAAVIERIVLGIIVVAAEVEPYVNHVIAPIIIEDKDALVKRLAGDGIVEIVLLSELGKLLKIIIDQKLVLRFEMIEESPVRHTGGSADIADREIGIAFFL